jgi:hypothetical protein
VRRITPSGEVNFAEPFVGVIHPLTHVLVVSPRVGGGDAGADGGGDAGADGGATAVVVGTEDAPVGRMIGLDALVGCATFASPPPHADTAAAAARIAARIENRRGRGGGLRRTGSARISRAGC